MRKPKFNIGDTVVHNGKIDFHYTNERHHFVGRVTSEERHGEVEVETIHTTYTGQMGAKHIVPVTSFELKAPRQDFNTIKRMILKDEVAQKET